MNKKIVDTQALKQIAGNEFADIVTNVQEPFTNELRIKLNDDSFIDVWFSINLENRYSYHWERKHIDGLIYRHDNAPHIKWKDITTFPKHFHNQTEENIEPSYISDKPENAIREMMSFAKSLLKNIDNK
ncbi:MAG: hypothetical protein HY738_12695 [Bacteroidia bacterium]|nr:hypothetical protein [Bacteroidia bacterium]